MHTFASNFSPKKTKKYGIVIAILWTLSLLITSIIDRSIDRKDLIKEALLSAKSAFEKDLMYRRWNASHGGVYVPLTEHNPSNPYLDVPDRDIVSKDGKAYTLVNPAYMTRQVHELGQKSYGTRGHITSLNPIRPQNAPDAWEASALRSFQQGNREIFSEEIIENNPYLRFMKPIITERQCLKCHEKQGYREGDIRGGISVSVPLAPYFVTHAKHVRFSIFVIGLIWATGLGVVFVGTKQFNKQAAIREEYEKQRRQAQEKMIQQNYYLEKAQELGQIGTWELDLKANRLYWTDEACRIFGVPPGSILNYQSFLEKVHPEDRLFIDREWKAALEGKSYDLEHRLLIDGNVKWVREKASLEIDKQGKAVKAIGVTQDISSQKGTENALQLILKETSFKTGSEYFQSLIEKLATTLGVRYSLVGKLINADLIRTISVWADGRLANNFEYDLKDTPCENVVGQSTCFFTRDTQKLYPKDALLAEMGVESYLGTPIVDHKGKALGILLVMDTRPMEDGLLARQLIEFFAARCAAELVRQESEEERRTLEAELFQSQKMESIGTLAGGIAHDFNNILTAIMGYTEVAISDLNENRMPKEFLEQIFGAGNRAKDLVRQILDFSRQTEREMKPVRIQSVIKEALKLLRASLPSSIDIRQEIEDASGMVLADATQIHQVIMNLCTNAQHAMMIKGGGVLRIQLRHIELTDNNIGSLEIKPGHYMLLSVTDTGCGMNRATMDRIFDPYFTTKEKGIGTGLGLAVVKGIIRNHQGEIAVSSDVGKGTTFDIYWPIIDRKEPLEEQSGPMIGGGGELILFVDDEKAVADLGKQMLSRLGYKVETRTNSIEALEAFRHQPQKYDMVVTDLTMPGMTGDKLAREILKIRPEIPIIMCTGFSEAADRDMISKIGIRKLLMKPILMANMARAIREALDVSG